MAEELRVVDQDKKQYIVVKIGSEQYGLDINYVDNIVRMQKITRVPKAQSYFRGIINLRGEIVPVMSIRRKMELPDDEFTNNTRIIILKIEQQGSIGIIVDEVKEVVTLGEDQVDKNNSYEGKGGKPAFINGIGHSEEDLISIFDINAIIDEKENG
ncbi:MAG: chemotaxis protein CheW [Lachnospiraceae bacterium]